MVQRKQRLPANTVMRNDAQHARPQPRKQSQHQVFGRFSGTATLDDGTVLPVRDLIGFAEEVENHW